MKLPESITGTTTWLTDTIPLNVYFVQGSQSGILVDSGINAMHDDLLAMVKQSGVPLKAILHTHSHHDHIGGSARLKQSTGCTIVAPKTYSHWHHDWEAHYAEFARPFPSIFHDTPELREEVFGILDDPHQVDSYCQEGDCWDLGGGIRLQCFRFAGHMLEEVGWLEEQSKTLILGDVITLLEAPFIHGHLTVAGYWQSLEKLRQLVDEQSIKQVLMAHFPPMGTSAFLDLIHQAEIYLRLLEDIIISKVRSGAADLKTVWLQTIAHLDKQQEFRSLSTVDAHLQDLAQEGLIKYENQQIKIT